MCKWQLVKGGLDPQAGHPQHPGGHPCLVPWFQRGPCTSRQGVTGVWATPGCTLLDKHTHTYLCFTWKWLLCYHCNNFPHRWASHHIWAVPPSHLLTSTLSICWSSFGNHSIWEKVLHCREPREEAMQRKRSCNVKDWHKFCRGIPVRRKLWETLQCFHNLPAVLLYFKCFSLPSVCCGFGLGQLFPSSCFPAFPLPLPKGVKGL